MLAEREEQENVLLLPLGSGQTLLQDGGHNAKTIALLYCKSIFQAYVNMALFENFTYAGIDATAEEA